MATLIENSNNQARGQIIIPVGVTDPPFTDSITRNGESVSLQSAKFFMRPLVSRKPVIDGEEAGVINPPDSKGNNVKYEWEESDVAIEGEYMAWWSFEVDGGTFETPEFLIIITDHGPGLGANTGAIVDGVAQYMPVTLNALRNDTNFGDRRLQHLATLMQVRVTKTYVEPDQEDSQYALPLLDYFSKRVALELCTPGIDYWMRQHRAQSAQGPAEMSSFPDAIATLKSLRERLKGELQQDWRDLRYLVPGLPQRKAMPMPITSLSFEDHTDNSGNLIARSGPIEYVTADPRITQPLRMGYWSPLDSLILGFYPFP